MRNKLSSMLAVRDYPSTGFLWLGIIFVQILASVLIGLAGRIHYGTGILALVLWIALCFSMEGLSKMLRLAAAGLGVVFLYLMFRDLSSFWARSIITYEGILLLMLWSLRGNPSDYAARAFPVRKISPAGVVILILGGIGLYPALVYVSELMSFGFQNMVSIPQGNIFFVFFLFAAVPAIVEEMFFRGILFASLPRNKKAVIITAVLFALIHMNFNQISYALMAGAIFGIMRYVTGSILPGMIVHMTINGTSVLMAQDLFRSLTAALVKISFFSYHPFAPNMGQGAKADIPMIITGGVCSLLLLAVCGLLLFAYIKKEGSLPECPAETQAVRKSSPAIYIGCAICIIVAVFLR